MMLDNIKDSAKIPLLVGVIFIVLLTIAALYWVLNKEYQPLFSDMLPEDSASMIGQLDTLETHYRINNKTGNIEVPASEIHSTRLKLMSTDIALTGGVGYEIFDNSDFGMTEFAQKINYQRALEGELQRTITALEQVRQARVHLVMADRGLFRDKKNESTASITLLLQDNAQLRPESIKGIQRLVSASVPDLKENKVTISNHNGKTLTEALPGDESIQMVPWQLQQKIQAESYLSEKINKVLSKAYDLDKISISVDIVMDFSKVKKMEEQVVPIEKSQAVIKEKEVRLGGKDASNRNGQNITREVEYKMGRSVAEIVESPGRIARITIGVMLPDNIPEKSLVEIQRLIEVTVGISKERGDSIAVYGYKPVSSDNDSISESEILSAREAVIENLSSVSDQTIMSDSITENNDKSSPLVELHQKELNGQWERLISQYYWLFVIIILSAVSLLFIKFLPRNKPKKLSADEREKVLMQLQHWLSDAR